MPLWPRGQRHRDQRDTHSRILLLSEYAKSQFPDDIIYYEYFCIRGIGQGEEPNEGEIAFRIYTLYKSKGSAFETMPFGGTVEEDCL